MEDKLSKTSAAAEEAKRETIARDNALRLIMVAIMITKSDTGTPQDRSQRLLSEGEKYKYYREEGFSPKSGIYCGCISEGRMGQSVKNAI